MIRVDALTRMGQVSLLAAVSLRLIVFGAVIVGGLVLAAHAKGGAWFARVVPYACAAVAGLASAVVAGGVVAILHRTPFAMGATLGGDSAVLASWSDQLNQGTPIPGVYPPMQIYLISWISRLFSIDSLYAAKHFQVLGILLVGPLSYGAWRLLLRPVWALGLGVVCALPFIDPYRAYPMMVLLVFIPIVVKFIDGIRTSSSAHWYELVRCGVGFGLAFGLLFLMYSGWVQWSAPGILLAVMFYMPWRDRPSHALILASITALLFFAMTFHYLSAVVHASAIHDDYMYFDATVDPSYIAMWRGSQPGSVPMWPPPGELGGVGLFTVLLTAGTGTAIWLGSKRTLVVTVSLILGCTWLWRMWCAHHLYETKLVQLYPRTTGELLYGAMILTGFSIYLAIEHLRARQTSAIWQRPSATVGLVVALLLLIMSTGSATTDRYNPNSDITYAGYLSWVALRIPLLGGNQAIEAKRTQSEVVSTADHEAWVQLEMPAVRTFSSVALTPDIDGFPVDFDVQVWDGTQWLTRAHVANQAVPTAPLVFRWKELDYASLFRVRATRLRPVGEGFGLHLKKIELYR